MFLRNHVIYRVPLHFYKPKGVGLKTRGRATLWQRSSGIRHLGVYANAKELGQTGP